MISIASIGSHPSIFAFDSLFTFSWDNVASTHHLPTGSIFELEFAKFISVSIILCVINGNMDFSIDTTAFGPGWMSNNAVIIASGGGITGDTERPSCDCCAENEGQSRSPKHNNMFLDPIFIYVMLIAFIICK